MTQSRPLFILVGNGAYDNRGCEAIIRGTVKILRYYYENPLFICVSHFQNNDQFEKQCKEESDISIIHKKTNRPLNKFDIIWWLNRFFRGLNPNSNIYYHVYKEIFPYIDESKAVLSVGGDNYSLDYGIPKLFTNLDDIILRKNKTLSIWGASIGPFSKNPKYEKYIITHLQNVDLIFARESTTIKYLLQNGLTENVYDVSDPAFLMESLEPQGDNKFQISGNAIGINLSPLMAKYVTNGNLKQWTELATEIVSLISKGTSLPIYLIPHVTSSNSDDYAFLKDVLLKANDSYGPIKLISPNYNAAETKWIISQMILFAGARTHSTIAALSSCVPTLSFTYSIKAKGINQDIFDHNEYCLDPNDLKPELVLEKIECMLEKREEIINHLIHKVPIIQNKALMAGKYLHDILEGKCDS